MFVTEWLFRNENGWEKDEIKENNSKTVWAEILRKIVIHDIQENTAIWLMCIPKDYPAAQNSVIGGIKSAIRHFIQENKIGLYVKEYLHGEQTEEGKLLEKGYYLVLCEDLVVEKKILSMILDIFDEPSQEIGIGIIRKFLPLEGHGAIEQRVIRNIEDIIDKSSNIIRKVSPENKDLEIKLRIFIIVEDCFTEVENGAILLPQQVKSVGRITNIPAYSADKRKIINNLGDKENEQTNESIVGNKHQELDIGSRSLDNEKYNSNDVTRSVR